jgi:hypothetical protein
MTMVIDPVLVLAVADGEARLEALCERVAAVEGCTVVGALGGRAALRHVSSRYELPSGCPDIVVLDSGVADLVALHIAFDETCPGVRHVVAAPDSPTLEQDLHEVAQLVHRSFVS